MENDQQFTAFSFQFNLFGGKSGKLNGLFAKTGLKHVELWEWHLCRFPSMSNQIQEFLHISSLY